MHSAGLLTVRVGNLQIRRNVETNSDTGSLLYAPHQYVNLFAFGVVVLASLLIFVVPFFVPTAPASTVSASLLAGFSNGTATVCTVLVSAVVLVTSWWLDRDHPERPENEDRGSALPGRLLAVTIATTALIQVCAAWMVTVSRQRDLADAGYFIEQATVRADTGHSLYSQMEFAYGPLLLLPEVWLSKLLHCRVSSAYFALLVIESALGLLMLAALLNSFAIGESARKYGFVLLAIAAITPHLGLNYTLFRFASPFVVLLWASRAKSPWVCAAICTLGEMTELLVSPELGLALCVGVVCFGAVRTIQSGWRWACVAIVPTATLASLLLTLGRPYLKMASMFSHGALNLPVGPYPHILLLLFAVLWMVPRSIGRRFSFRENGSAYLLAFYALSIAFLPAALGRCDPLHVMFNGTGIWVLFLLALGHSSATKRKVSLACLAFVVLWDHKVNERLFIYRDAVTVRQSVLRHLPSKLQDHLAGLAARRSPLLGYLLSRQAAQEPPVDIAEMTSYVGHDAVATPMEISPTVEAQLRQAHLYSPGYFAFWVDTMNLRTEERVVAEANAHRWMLMPVWWRRELVHVPENTKLFQGLDLHYRTRKPLLYEPGALFDENLKRHWSKVQTFGWYVLYEHTNGPGVSAQGDSSAPLLFRTGTQR